MLSKHSLSEEGNTKGKCLLLNVFSPALSILLKGNFLSQATEIWKGSVAPEAPSWFPSAPNTGLALWARSNRSRELLCRVPDSPPPPPSHTPSGLPDAQLIQRWALPAGFEPNLPGHQPSLEGSGYERPRPICNTKEGCVPVLLEKEHLRSRETASSSVKRNSGRLFH